MRIIAGKFKSRRIFAPKIDIVRPTSDKMRETIFNILCHNNHLPLNLKNSSVLDLFSGSGAMSFEAISRGAKNATLIESNKDCISVINKNAEILGVNNIIKIIQLDATQLPINTINHNYCFIDPPYFKGFTEPALISAQKKGWLAPKATIVCELSKSDNFYKPENMDIVYERKLGNSQIIFLINKS